MADIDGATTNYGWVMPADHGSLATWGAKLNADLQAIDAQVHANQTAIQIGSTIIGEIKMFGGTTAPDNWLLCDGSSIPRAAPYDKLFAVIGASFGSVDSSSFNLPDFGARSPIGVGMATFGPVAVGAAGGESAHILVEAEIPGHTHPIEDPLHTHPISDPQHVHAQNSPHTHPASQDAHRHGGVIIPGGNFSLGVGPYTTQGGFTDFQQPTVTVGPAYADIAFAATGVAVQPALTNINHTDGAGGGASHNTYHPFLVINFIIRYQ
jgi:microcystin-dependent protein